MFSWLGRSLAFFVSCRTPWFGCVGNPKLLLLNRTRNRQGLPRQRPPGPRAPLTLASRCPRQSIKRVLVRGKQCTIVCRGKWVPLQTFHSVTSESRYGCSLTLACTTLFRSIGTIVTITLISVQMVLLYCRTEWYYISEQGTKTFSEQSGTIFPANRLVPYFLPERYIFPTRVVHISYQSGTIFLPEWYHISEQSGTIFPNRVIPYFRTERYAYACLLLGTTTVYLPPALLLQWLAVSGLVRHSLVRLSLASGRCPSFRCRRSGCGASPGAATPARPRRRPSTCATTPRYSILPV